MLRDGLAIVDEAALIAKLAKIEALFAGAATEGERAAAAGARDRILERLREVEKADPLARWKERSGKDF